MDSQKYDHISVNAKSMEDDLEVDCAPESSELDRLRILQRVSDKQCMSEDPRCDSAYGSGFKSVDIESCDSGLPSDLSEGRPLNSVEHLIPINTFQKLSLSKRQIDKIPEDEGFVSEDQPLDLSRKPLKQEASEEYSCQNNHPEVSVETYIQHVNETFQQDEDGDTRLHTAIIQLLFDFALYCISLAPTPEFLNIKNNFQQTSLHLAAITRQPQLARKLVTSGAQVDARDHHGNTALHIASKEGHADVAEVLLTPVQYKETCDNTYSIPYQAIPQNLEARNYDGQVCIHLAAENCHIDVLALLLEKGADINCRDGKSGRTVLHYAAESGNLQLLQFLLNHPKIDVNVQTYSRLTPVMLAKGRGNTEATRLLKEHGAAVESEESEEEDMNEDYDDFKIGGNPV